MIERAGAWLDACLRHRLWFSETDEHDSASLPFGMCARGDLAVARRVSCGTVASREVRAFDLEILVLSEESAGWASPQDLVEELLGETDEEAETTPGYALRERWECALVRADAECYRLAVSPEGVLSTLADAALVPDQDLELEAFNRAFEVRANDRRFANDFLDPGMAWFLLEHATGCVLETVGNRILVARPPGDLPDLDALLALAFGVADRVPNAVKVLHPALPAGELTPRCPIGADGRARHVGAPDARRAPFDPWPDVPSGWA
jgi:hypothetical protein